MQRRPFTEFGVCALIAGLCAIVLAQALKLPPGRFEPLGSGPVPIWTSSIVIQCCGVVMLRALLFLRGQDTGAVLRYEFTGGNPMGGAVVMGLTLAYVLALHVQLAGFGILSFVYLTLLILGLEGFARRRILPALIVAAVAAFGAQYIFTQVFVVDLPV